MTNIDPISVLDTVTNAIADHILPDATTPMQNVKILIMRQASFEQQIMIGGFTGAICTLAGIAVGNYIARRFLRKAIPVVADAE